MADQESDVLSSTDFNAFLKEKGIEKECLECGINKWNVLVDGENGDLPGPTVRVFVGTIPNQTLRHHFPVVVMWCANCGVTKLISTEIVKAWRDKRG